MTPGRIAVILTCHNLGRTLLEALVSVERQTRPPAQIVVVDDRSTDVYTKQVLARIQRDGTRVAVADGRGASAARNLGVRLTAGDYLVWLDADDVLEPTWLETAAARLDADPELDFVSCALRAFEGANYVWTPSVLTFVGVVSTGGVPHASTMVRRTLWDTVGGFDEAIPSYELLDFWASALERGARGVVIDQPLLNYRVRPGSGYRRSIQPDVYRSRLSQFYEKHRAALERDNLKLILGKEAFLQSQREYRKVLESRAGAIEAEIAWLRREIADTAAALESSGSSRVNWGDLRRIQPISQSWGWDRGKPVDRYYIDKFIETHRTDIRGRVLEVRDSTYTQGFGGVAVTTCDVIDIDPANSMATVVADLRGADAIPTGTYDCIILTQTLQLIDDVRSTLAECSRILRPGGVLLVTVPSVSRVDDEGGLDGDFWRFTEASARKLFAEAFPIDSFEVTSYGNVLSCAAFLYGLSVEEMRPGDLDCVDPNFPAVIAIRAVKPDTADAGNVDAGVVNAGLVETGAASRLGRTPAGFFGVVLSYHRIATLTPDSHALCTPPDEFREQMAFIRREYTPIALDDLVRAAASGRIPERAVAVTLDDGYLDALTTASPVLSEFGVPATFFVNSDRLDEEHERSWDMLERIFLTEPVLPPLLKLEVAGSPLQFATGTTEERTGTLERLNQIMWSLDAKPRSEVVDRIITWSRASPAPRGTHRVLTGNEIRALAGRPGHSIGAHTVHHLALTTQPAGAKRREVFEDKAALESLLQKPVHLFAYPYGESDAELAGIVSQAGFLAAVTVEAGRVSAGANRLWLPRYEVTAAARGAGFPRLLNEIFEGMTLCDRSH